MAWPFITFLTCELGLHHRCPGFGTTPYMAPARAPICICSCHERPATTPTTTPTTAPTEVKTDQEND